MDRQTRENLFAVNRRQSEVASQRQELKQEAVKLRWEKEKARSNFVASTIADFLGYLGKNAWAENDYIMGRYSCDLTQYVSRCNLFLSHEHDVAKHAYMEAFRNLNRVFLQEIRKPEIQERLVDYARLKNLGRMKD